MSVIVIKVGGEIFTNDVLPALAKDVVALAAGGGHRPIMVHGGGPQASAMQKKLGLEPHMVGGRRVTDEATLDVMKMVVGGRLNIDLCAALIRAGGRPVGLHGASSLVIEARKRPPRVMAGAGSEPVDYGLVGDITNVDRPLLELLTGAGHIPVLACLGASRDGVVLNINADVIANYTAEAMAADHLVLVTGTSGVLRDVANPDSRIERLTADEAQAAIEDGTISGGMIPKITESLRVLATGHVGSVHIVGGLRPGGLEREISTPGAVGTVLVP